MAAIQDQIPNNHCYGCGTENPLGMQIKSHWDGDVSKCTYVPRPEQCAGPTQYLYGGTIASLIDCHSVGTAMSAFYRREGRETGDPPEIWCVTARLSVDYLKPTAIDHPVELHATIDAMTDKKAVVQTTVYSNGAAVAKGEVVAVRVSDSWREK